VEGEMDAANGSKGENTYLRWICTSSPQKISKENFEETKKFKEKSGERKISRI